MATENESALVKRMTQENAVATPWTWRTQQGNFMLPSEMETRHLFYTLRMIWNHKMPEVARFPAYQQYEFSAFYTDVYFRQAILFLTEELAQRDNMIPQWKADLDHMITWLARYQLQMEQRQQVKK